MNKKFDYFVHVWEIKGLVNIDKKFKDIILKEFAFDVNDFKKLIIKHDFIIEELIISDEYKDDFTKARYHAKRRGNLVRHINLDGKESIKEKKISI